MIKSLPARLFCIFLSCLIAAPFGFAQGPPAPVPTTSRAAPAAPLPAPPNQAAGPLTVVILEGDKAVNSVPLLRSVAPIVEIRDQNDFPVEGVTVVFTLPAQGPGGTFAGGGATFTARSDSRGQAAAPAIVPRVAGKFEIKVSATLGARTGDAVIAQTNSTLARFGPDRAAHHWYKNKWVWIAAGGGVAVIVTVILVTGGGSSKGNTITITPGTPVFQ
jgi:hypothetical protein